jgi:ATP-dependent RNA helicase RhlE
MTPGGHGPTGCAWRAGRAVPARADTITIESKTRLTNFAALGLAAPILETLAAENYSTPTPIQAQAIPHILAGRDLLGLAQTGTGKTAAFALPILHRLAANSRRAPRRGCRVLALAPTRELASQIAESFRVYGRGTKPSIAVVFGGVGAQPQVRAMANGVDVLVATPGRLLDLIDQGNICLKSLEYLVLDEVDRMLDMGFIAPVRRIVRLVPRQRQTLLFSATLPTEIRGLAAELLDQPEEVAVAPQASTVERIEQRVIHVQQRDKPALLASLMADMAITRALVFTRTKRGADRVTRHLEASGVGATAIHGNKSQGQREQALHSFRSGRARVLVATDIAARGIDVDGVSHVINFELPNIPESYVHRIGRTARAGASGIAISFCDSEERPYLRDIETLISRRLPVHDHHLAPRGGTAASAATPVPAAKKRQPAGHVEAPRSNGDGKRANASRSKPKAQPDSASTRRPRSGSRPAATPRPASAHAPRNGAGVRSTGQAPANARGSCRTTQPDLPADLSHLSFLAPPKQKPAHDHRSQPEKTAAG